MTEITLKSGCTYEQNPLIHDGEECGYVLKGQLTVFLNGNEYLLDMVYLALFLIPSLLLGLVLRKPVIRLNNWVSRNLESTKVM